MIRASPNAPAMRYRYAVSDTVNAQPDPSAARAAAVGVLARPSDRVACITVLTGLGWILARRWCRQVSPLTGRRCAAVS